MGHIDTSNAGTYLALLASVGPLIGLLLLEARAGGAEPLWYRRSFAVLCTALAAGAIYWVLGFGLVNGKSVGGLFGHAAVAWVRSPLAPAVVETALVVDVAMLLALLLFPIVETASLVVIGLLFGGAIFPFVAHSTWNPDGLLRQFGFADGSGALALFASVAFTAAFVIERSPAHLRTEMRRDPHSQHAARALVGLVTLVAFGLGRGSAAFVALPSFDVLAESLVATLASAWLLGFSIRHLLQPDEHELPQTLIVASLVSLLASGLHLAAWRGVALAILTTFSVALVRAAFVRLRVDDASRALLPVLAGSCAGVLANGLLFSPAEFVVTTPHLKVIAVQLSGVLVAALAATVPVALLMFAASRSRSDGIYRQSVLLRELVDVEPLREQLDRAIEVSGRGFRLSAEPAPSLEMIAGRVNRLLDRIEFSLLRHEAIVSALPVGIVTFSPARRAIVTANPALLAILGVELEAIVDQPMTRILAMAEDGANDGLEALLQSQVGSHRALELYGRHGDGSFVPVEATISEAEIDGVELFYCVAIRSIRAQKEREMALTRHREQLNELITEQAVRLAEARDQAQQASLAKSHFLANMSHELRTPMNAIIGYSEMMIEDAQQSGYDEMLPDLERVVTAGRHLLSLISDILDLSKIEVGKMEVCVETFALDTLVREVATTVEPLCARNENRFELVFDETLATIRSDSTKLRQILFNLLSNASKFTERGIIRLAISNEVRHSRRFVRIIVEDDGIGMTPEQLDRVFDEFTQADPSTTRKYGGTGLGLALVRRFSHMLGGEIIAESEVGKGSRFTVYLPCELSIDRPLVESDPGLTSSTSVPAGEGALVLVIDGRSATRDWLQTNLTQAGHRVVTAWSGSEGLRLARILRPQVICVDPLISDIDGWGMIRETQRDPLIGGTEVVLLPISDNHKRGHVFATTTTLFKSELVTRLTDRAIFDVECWLVVTHDEELAAKLREVAAARDRRLVVTANEGNAYALLAEQRQSTALLLDLMMPNLESLRLLTRLVDDDRFESLPVLYAIADELDRVDRLRFQRALMKLLKLGNDRRERLISELLEHLALVAARERAKPHKPRGKTPSRDSGEYAMSS